MSEKREKPPVGQVAYPNPKGTPQPRTPTSRGASDTNNSDDEYMTEPWYPNEAGGVYASPIRFQYQNRVENSAIVPLPPRTVGGLRDQVEQTRACHCQKSNCLKLYCECFSSAVHCNAYCSCTSCENDGSVEHQSTRNQAILACLEQNPNTFRSTFLARPITTQQPADVVEAVGRATATNTTANTTLKPENVCNCNKSRCLKKYCECFRNDHFCTDNCKCVQCKNHDGDPDRERLVKLPPKMRGSATATAAAAPTKRSKAAEMVNAQQPQEDLIFLPSQNTVPMKLPGGVDSTTLAFGNGVTLKKRKKESSAGGILGAFDRAMATEEAVLARRKATDVAFAQKKKRRDMCVQQELERHWSEEARDVLGTFQAMRQELLQRKQDAGLLSADIVLSREYSYYDLVGSAQLAAVELDLADVLTSVREAEDRAKSLIATDSKEGKSEAAGKTMTQSTGSDKKSQRLSQSKRGEIISQAVQDTALMRELAQIIRSKALEMSESRKGGPRL